MLYVAHEQIIVRTHIHSCEFVVISNVLAPLCFMKIEVRNQSISLTYSQL